MATRKIAVLVGSLRKASFTRKLAKSLMLAAPPTLELDIVEIGGLPMYNEDDETDTPPPSWTEFRDRVREADGILFCTPEYNRSLPGALKNAIDVGSRPYGKAAWTGKPCAVVSQSPGALGGFGANHAVRQTLVFLNMPCMQMPEAYIGGITGKFDGDQLTDDGLRSFLQQFMGCFATWVERHAD
ncbi:NADPH-dependent FMN reductase [Massilia phyllosphaerae]|uniref:NADPH-dependent FMN reductase n=1 Tax=Massilia phyllosphaerae TaxID=3106034 RepID=UPI002B1CAAEF|nr:NAD(P)H-dependent oxidoreductase [Massilia sp. SGZ-792]